MYWYSCSISNKSQLGRSNTLRFSNCTWTPSRKIMSILVTVNKIEHIRGRYRWRWSWALQVLRCIHCFLKHLISQFRNSVRCAFNVFVEFHLPSALSDIHYIPNSCSLEVTWYISYGLLYIWHAWWCLLIGWLHNALLASPRPAGFTTPCWLM